MKSARLDNEPTQDRGAREVADMHEAPIRDDRFPQAERRRRIVVEGAISTTESAVLPDFVPAYRAIELLGIKPQTLYAYVARGWIGAIAQEGTHQKLYSREDVERVRLRSIARSGHGPVAAGALRWGEPVVSSSITEITGSGPRYRSHLATELVRHGCTFEAVADLIWTGVWSERTGGWDQELPPDAFYVIANDLVSRIPTMRFRDLLSMLVELLSATQNGNPELKLGGTAPAARQIIQVLAGAFACLHGEPLIVPLSSESVACLLGRALNVRSEHLALFDAMLILCADHELATATFAARVAASTGANLNTCVLAGIAAFEGPLTGGDAAWTDELVRTSASRAILLEEFAQARENGWQIPGFSHPLYPKGDPRASLLIDAVTRMSNPAPGSRALLEFIDECARRWQVRPSLPVALVAVQLALNLPQDAPGALFLLARIAGYAAHVQEQRLSGFLVRPRAKFAP
ncbi:citrate/2-methylcitrate synthase [Cupriavidus sp. 8B]